jgi:hypothetical protein
MAEATIDRTTALTGGEAMVAHLTELQARITNAKSVQVGFIENAKYPGGASIPMVAAIQEFGAPAKGIPPRPFFRQAIAKHKGEWGDNMATALVNTNFDAKMALAQVGYNIQNQVQASIFALQAPKLSPVTVMLRHMRKGKVDAPVTFDMVLEARRRVAKGESPGDASTKPLVWSGQMANRVDYQVS